MVMLFSLHTSMQNLSLPSLSWTRTTAAAHGLDEGLITPISNISWRCLQTSSNMDWGISWYLLWNGCEFGSTLISCCTTEVSPRCRSCQENTSTNSDNKSAASLQSSSDQDVHPNRLLCLSMVLSSKGTFGLVLVGNQPSFSLLRGCSHN